MNGYHRNLDLRAAVHRELSPGGVSGVERKKCDCFGNLEGGRLHAASESPDSSAP